MKLPTVRNEFGEAMRVTGKMREKLVECLLSEKGLVYYNDLMPDRDDVADERTIHACEERGLLRHAVRRGGFHSYAFALTPVGRKFAVTLVNEKLLKMEEVSKRPAVFAAEIRKPRVVFQAPASRMVN